MSDRVLVAAASMLLVTAAAACRAEQGWGTLKGRFVVEGVVPDRPALAPGNDPVCHAAAPVDESVLVGEGGGLRNAVVSVHPPRGALLPVHPDLDSAADHAVELTNRQCAFSPRVTLLRTRQTLLVKNAGPTAHNTHLKLLSSTPINRVIPAGGEFQASFDRAERKPVRVSCSVHPFMRGFLLVRDDPYAAISDGKGRFAIEKLPAGEHPFHFWHETGSLQHVAFDDGEADRRGRVPLTIPSSGVLDLGMIRVPSELLAH